MCASCQSWYGRHIAPYVVHAGCSADAFTRMRRRMVPLAQGVVVEVGFGSGLNLLYYDPDKVTRLVGVDPDETMLSLAKRQSGAKSFAMECLQAGAESMPRWIRGHGRGRLCAVYHSRAAGGAGRNPPHPEAGRASCVS